MAGNWMPTVFEYWTPTKLNLCQVRKWIQFSDFRFLHFWDNGYYLIFRNIHYIDFDGVEHYYTLHDFPGALEKKVKLLNYFMNYMKEHLLKAGADIQVMEVVYYPLSSNFSGKRQYGGYLRNGY